MRNHLKKYWKVYAWGILIMILSCFPADNKGSDWLSFKHADKLFHALFYGIFSALIILTLSGSSESRSISIYTLILAFLMVLLFGSLMEIVQHYLIITRIGDPLDVVFNMFGWVIAAVLLYLRAILFMKRSH